MPRTLSHCHILVQRSPASIPKRLCRSSHQFANPTHHTNTLQTHTCTWDCYTIPWCTMPMGEEKMKKFHNVSAAPPLCRFSNFVSCEAGGRYRRARREAQCAPTKKNSCGSAALHRYRWARHRNQRPKTSSAVMALKACGGYDTLTSTARITEWDTQNLSQPVTPLRTIGARPWRQCS